MDALRAGDPDRIGAYRLVGRLGSGGMGQVFLGRSAGGRPVAVKVIRPEYGADAGFRRSFAREVEAARRVGGFFTAQVVDADPDAERPWLVSAFVPGPSLHTVVSEHGGLPTRALRVLAAGLAEGLDAIHRCGLVHRDLKPGNVVVAGRRTAGHRLRHRTGVGGLVAHGQRRRRGDPRLHVARTGAWGPRDRSGQRRVRPRFGAGLRRHRSRPVR